MLRYTPVNLAPVPRLRTAPLGDVTPLKPQPPASFPVPSWGVNLLIVGTGTTMAVLGFPHRKKVVGELLVEVGAGMAAIGLIFGILDIAGFTRP